MITLTKRQRDIAELLCQGYENREIADKLGIAVNTVKTHLAFLMKRLGARNRTHAAVLYTLASADADRVQSGGTEVV